MIFISQPNNFVNKHVGGIINLIFYHISFIQGFGNLVHLNLENVQIQPGLVIGHG